jgi:hypothetical protein
MSYLPCWASTFPSLEGKVPNDPYQRNPIKRHKFVAGALWRRQTLLPNPTRRGYQFNQGEPLTLCV